MTHSVFQGRSFLAEKDFTRAELEYLIGLSAHLKDLKKRNIQHHYLAGKNIALLFEKTSTRTRAAFTTAAIDLGAHPEYLGANDIQLGKKESTEDTAKVLGRMFDGIEFRGFSQRMVEELAEFSGVPVWNGLTDEWHPTQMLADYLTVQENFGRLEGLTLVYCGDGRNNVANSLLVTGAILGVNVHIFSPKELFPEKEIVELTKDGVKLGCATICINPAYIELCEPYVKGSDTMLCPVTDFPFGTSSTESRVKQIEAVAKYDTVKEIDIVANFGLIRSGKYEEITKDIKACVEAAHKFGKEIKIIFETDALNEEQIRKTCKCCIEARVDFVKTSIGFLTGHENKGAIPKVIKIMQEEVGNKCKVKGSGAIRTREHFLELIDMGIDRMWIGYKSVPVVLNLKSENDNSTGEY